MADFCRYIGIDYCREPMGQDASKRRGLWERI